MGYLNAFAKWPSGIHDTADQKKRLESAKSSKQHRIALTKSTNPGCLLALEQSRM